MNWDLFIWFAVPSLLLWNVGALCGWYRRGRRMALFSTLAGTLLFLSFILIRWSSEGAPPLRSVGDTRLCYSLFLSLVSWVIYLQRGYRWILTFSALLASLFVCLNLFLPEQHERALPPLLQSPWFIPHVVCYMFSYALFGAAFLVALYHLFLAKGNLSQRELRLCDGLTLRGFVFMTFGILLGAWWAKQAWGDYWSWDPKETWAAATWLSYLGYLHLRIAFPSYRKLPLVLLILSYLCLQICWYGINYLPSAMGMSVHTYN